MLTLEPEKSLTCTEMTKATAEGLILDEEERLGELAYERFTRGELTDKQLIATYASIRQWSKMYQRLLSLIAEFEEGEGEW